MTLPTDATARKAIPIVRGCLDYFPAALAAVAEVSRVGNEQHNKGQELHHARGKSTDHADCIVRHLMQRGEKDTDGVLHSVKVAWRALALAQEELEALGAPLARGARLPGVEEVIEKYRATIVPAVDIYPSNWGTQSVRDVIEREMPELINRETGDGECNDPGCLCHRKRETDHELRPIPGPVDVDKRVMHEEVALQRGLKCIHPECGCVPGCYCRWCQQRRAAFTR